MAKTSILTIMIQLAKQGYGDREAVKGLAVLKAGLGNVVGAFGAITGAGFAAKAIFDQTGKVFVAYAAQVREMGRLTGASAEETSRLIQVADDVTISYESLQKALWAASKNGIEVNIESIALLADKYVALQGPTARAEFLAKSFGKSGAEMGKLLEKGGDGVRQMAAAIDDSLVINEAAVASARLYEIQLDNLNDQITAVKMSFGQGLVGLLTGSTSEIEKQAHAIFKLNEGYDFNTNMMGRYTDAQRAAWEEARKLATEQYLVANGLKETAKSADTAAQEMNDLTNASDEVSSHNKDLLSLIFDMQNETQNYTTKNDELKAKLAELTLEQDKYFEGGRKWNEIQGEIDETKASVDQLAAEHEAASKRIVFSLLQQKMAVDGLSTAEFASLLQIGTQWKIIDQKTAESAILMDAQATHMAQSLDKPRGTMMDLIARVQNLQKMSGSTFDFWVNIYTSGSFPSFRASVPSKTTVHPLASGGELSGWSMVGEEGFEIISPRGHVFSHEQSVEMVAGGMQPENKFAEPGDIYTTSGSGSRAGGHTAPPNTTNTRRKRNTDGGGSTSPVSPVSSQNEPSVEDVIAPMTNATVAAVQSSAAAQQQAVSEGVQTRSTIQKGNEDLRDELKQLNEQMRQMKKTLTNAVVSAVQQAVP